MQFNYPHHPLEWATGVDPKKINKLAESEYRWRHPTPYTTPSQQINGSYTVLNYMNMRPSRWRTDALFQCSCSGIWTMHCNATGPYALLHSFCAYYIQYYTHGLLIFTTHNVYIYKVTRLIWKVNNKFHSFSLLTTSAKIYTHASGCQ